METTRTTDAPGVTGKEGSPDASTPASSDEVMAWIARHTTGTVTDAPGTADASADETDTDSDATDSGESGGELLSWVAKERAEAKERARRQESKERARRQESTSTAPDTYRTLAGASRWRFDTTRPRRFVIGALVGAAALITLVGVGVGEAMMLLAMIPAALATVALLFEYRCFDRNHAKVEVSMTREGDAHAWFDAERVKSYDEDSTDEYARRAKEYSQYLLDGGARSDEIEAHLARWRAVPAEVFTVYDTGIKRRVELQSAARALERVVIDEQELDDYRKARDLA